jgi:hypothetical protein
MPIEKVRLTEADIEKFRMVPAQRALHEKRWSDGQAAWTLVPFRCDGPRTHTLGVSRSEWEAALKLSKKGGFFGADHDGMSSGQVKSLAHALRGVVEGGQVEDAGTRAFVERLVAFLDGPARFGFTLVRGWRKAGR